MKKPPLDKHIKPEHHDGQDLTKGNIPRQLWSLAWPMML